VHPSEFDESGVGVLLAYDDLNAVDWPANAPIKFDRVDLTLYGVFGTYAGSDWKLTGTWYYALADLHAATPGVDHRFMVGYVQAERTFQHAWTPFVRWEDSVEAGRSRYLSLYDQFARTRHVAGLRWDFAQRQALTFQFTDTRTLRGDFKDVRLQWSTALF
jgi:hypothetical protein